LDRIILSAIETRIFLSSIIFLILRETQTIASVAAGAAVHHLTS
jgi:hypothetical protein